MLWSSGSVGLGIAAVPLALGQLGMAALAAVGFAGGTYSGSGTLVRWSWYSQEWLVQHLAGTSGAHPDLRDPGESLCGKPRGKPTTGRNL